MFSAYGVVVAPVLVILATCLARPTEEQRGAKGGSLLCLLRIPWCTWCSASVGGGDCNV